MMSRTPLVPGRRGRDAGSTAGPPSDGPRAQPPRDPLRAPARRQPLPGHAPQLRRHPARDRRGDAPRLRLPLGLPVALATLSRVPAHPAPDRGPGAPQLAGDRRIRKPAFPVAWIRHLPGWVRWRWPPGMAVSRSDHRDCRRHLADPRHHASIQPGFTHIGCCTSLWNGGCDKSKQARRLERCDERPDHLFGQAQPRPV